MSLQTKLEVLERTAQDLGYRIVEKSTGDCREILINTKSDPENQMTVIGRALLNDPQLKWFDLNEQQEAALAAIQQLSAPVENEDVHAADNAAADVKNAA